MCVAQRAVGDHIQSLPGRQGESERRLWSFVSSFTENKMDGDKLQKLYVKLKANKTMGAASGACVRSPAAVFVCLLPMSCGQPGLCMTACFSLLASYLCAALLSDDATADHALPSISQLTLAGTAAVNTQFVSLALP